MALFTEHSARLVADAARRQAGYRGHRLDRFQREAGRPTAVCGCGTYVFVDRDGMGHVWGYGRLPGTPGAWAQCRRLETQSSDDIIAAANRGDVVALTGPGSLLEALTHERTTTS